MNNTEELIQLWNERNEKKYLAFLKKQVVCKNINISTALFNIIKEEKENGLIIRETVKAYFRIKRVNTMDCTPLFELYDLESIIITESLFEVLGYDKMIPSINDQEKIIHLFFNFGENIDLKYCTDPRYGLAAACAGWEPRIVDPFLRKCLTSSDAPLKYVAKNSIKRKYVRLR